jgi:hypothetical protein
MTGWRLLQVEPSVQKLYDYIYERGTIIPIEDYDRDLLSHGDVSKRVTESIRAGTEEWESLVRCMPHPFPIAQSSLPSADNASGGWVAVMLVAAAIDLYTFTEGTDAHAFWPSQVPQHVRDQIKSLNLLGYRGGKGSNGHQNGSSNGAGAAQKRIGAAAGSA